MAGAKKPQMDPVADLLGSARIVSYKVDFALLTGSVTAGLLLSQFWYWSASATARERDGWFYVTMDQISDQTGMIREEQETARKRLKALGVLEEKRIGVPAQMWYRLDKDALYELLSDFAAFREKTLQDAGRGPHPTQNAGFPQTGKAANKIEGIPQSVMREFRNLARGKAADKDVGMAQSLILETSPETSLKISQTREDPPYIPPGGGEGKPDRMQIVWAGVMAIIAEMVATGEINSPTYHGHLMHLTLSELTETTHSVVATISAPSAFTREWVEKRQGNRLKAALAAVLGRDAETIVIEFRGERTL